MVILSSANMSSVTRKSAANSCVPHVQHSKSPAMACNMMAVTLFTMILAPKHGLPAHERRRIHIDVRFLFNVGHVSVCLLQHCLDCLLLILSLLASIMEFPPIVQANCSSSDGPVLKRTLDKNTETPRIEIYLYFLLPLGLTTMCCLHQWEHKEGGGGGGVS